MKALKTLAIALFLGISTFGTAQDAPTTTYAYLIGTTSGTTMYVTDAVQVSAKTQDADVIAQFNNLPADAIAEKWNVLRVASVEEATRQRDEMTEKYATRGITVKTVGKDR